MNRRGLVACSVLLIVCSAPPSWGESLDIFRAAIAIENERAQPLVKKKLGCDPCSEVLVSGSGGTPVRYLVTRNRTLSFKRTDLKRAVVQEGKVADSAETNFQLMVELSSSAREALVAISQLPADYGVNYIGGKLVGVGPLFPFGPYYVVGTFRTRDEANEAAGLLGVKISFIPYDDELHKRIRDRLLKGSQ